MTKFINCEHLRTNFRKALLLILFVIFSSAIPAQVSRVDIQCSGLTCSMCSNAINKSLKSLDFVDKIEPNIKTSTFGLTFKGGKSIDFDLLKKKIEDAGYSVANFVATVQFQNATTIANQAISVGDKTFEISNSKDLLLSGTRLVRVIDKGFVPAKEYKKMINPFITSPKGTYHVTIS